MLFGRIGVWLLALAIAFLPVVLGVASTPRHLPSVFGAAGLLPFYRDLMFSIITVLSISIIDGSEVLIRKRLPQRAMRSAAVVIILFCMLICILCAAWSTSTSTANIDDINMLIYILIIAVGAALTQRLLLISGD